MTTSSNTSRFNDLRDQFLSSKKRNLRIIPRTKEFAGYLSSKLLSFFQTESSSKPPSGMEVILDRSAKPPVLTFQQQPGFPVFSESGRSRISELTDGDSALVNDALKFTPEHQLLSDGFAYSRRGDPTMQLSYISAYQDLYANREFGLLEQTSTFIVMHEFNGSQCAALMESMITKKTDFREDERYQYVSFSAEIDGYKDLQECLARYADHRHIKFEREVLLDDKEFRHTRFNFYIGNLTFVCQFLYSSKGYYDLNFYSRVLEPNRMMSKCAIFLNPPRTGLKTKDHSIVSEEILRCVKRFVPHDLVYILARFKDTFEPFSINGFTKVSSQFTNSDLLKNRCKLIAYVRSRMKLIVSPTYLSYEDDVDRGNVRVKIKKHADICRACGWPMVNDYCCSCVSTYHSTDPKIIAESRDLLEKMSPSEDWPENQIGCRTIEIETRKDPPPGKVIQVLCENGVSCGERKLMTYSQFRASHSDTDKANSKPLLDFRIKVSKPRVVQKDSGKGKFIRVDFSYFIRDLEGSTLANFIEKEEASDQINAELRSFYRSLEDWSYYMDDVVNIQEGVLQKVIKVRVQYPPSVLNRFSGRAGPFNNPMRSYQAGNITSQNNQNNMKPLTISYRHPRAKVPRSNQSAPSVSSDSDESSKPRSVRRLHKELRPIDVLRGIDELVTSVFEDHAEKVSLSGDVTVPDGVMRRIIGLNKPKPGPGWNPIKSANGLAKAYEANIDRSILENIRRDLQNLGMKAEIYDESTQAMMSILSTKVKSTLRQREMAILRDIARYDPLVLVPACPERANALKRAMGVKILPDNLLITKIDKDKNVTKRDKLLSDLTWEEKTVFKNNGHSFDAHVRNFDSILTLVRSPRMSTVNPGKQETSLTYYNPQMVIQRAVRRLSKTSPVKGLTLVESSYECVRNRSEGVNTNLVEACDLKNPPTENIIIDNMHLKLHEIIGAAAASSSNRTRVNKIRSGLPAVKVPRGTSQLAARNWEHDVVEVIEPETEFMRQDITVGCDPPDRETRLLTREIVFYEPGEKASFDQHAPTIELSCIERDLAFSLDPETSFVVKRARHLYPNPSIRSIPGKRLLGIGSHYNHVPGSEVEVFYPGHDGWSLGVTKMLAKWSWKSNHRVKGCVLTFHRVGNDYIIHSFQCAVATFTSDTLHLVREKGFKIASYPDVSVRRWEKLTTTELFYTQEYRDYASKRREAGEPHILHVRATNQHKCGNMYGRQVVNYEVSMLKERPVSVSYDSTQPICGFENLKVYPDEIEESRKSNACARTESKLVRMYYRLTCWYKRTFSPRSPYFILVPSSDADFLERFRRIYGRSAKAESSGDQFKQRIKDEFFSKHTELPYWKPDGSGFSSTKEYDGVELLDAIVQGYQQYTCLREYEHLKSDRMSALPLKASPVDSPIDWLASSAAATVALFTGMTVARFISDGSKTVALTLRQMISSGLADFRECGAHYFTTPVSLLDTITRGATLSSTQAKFAAGLRFPGSGIFQRIWKHYTTVLPEAVFSFSGLMSAVLNVASVLSPMITAASEDNPAVKTCATVLQVASEEVMPMEYRIPAVVLEAIYNFRKFGIKPEFYTPVVVHVVSLGLSYLPMLFAPPLAVPAAIVGLGVRIAYHSYYNLATERASEDSLEEEEGSVLVRVSNSRPQFNYIMGLHVFLTNNGISNTEEETDRLIDVSSDWEDGDIIDSQPRFAIMKFSESEYSYILDCINHSIWDEDENLSENLRQLEFEELLPHEILHFQAIPESMSLIYTDYVNQTDLVEEVGLP